jgi:hypothetical protein
MRNIHLQKLPQKIESYLLDETCLSCFLNNKQENGSFAIHVPLMYM